MECAACQCTYGLHLEAQTNLKMCRFGRHMSHSGALTVVPPKKKQGNQVSMRSFDGASWQSRGRAEATLRFFFDKGRWAKKWKHRPHSSTLPLKGGGIIKSRLHMNRRKPKRLRQLYSRRTVGHSEVSPYSSRALPFGPVYVQIDAGGGMGYVRGAEQ